MLEITEPAICCRLTTLGAARAEVGLAPDDRSKDRLLAGLIDQASATVEAFTGRVFALEMVEETFCLPRVVFDLPMTRHPVCGVLRVHIEGERRCGAEKVRFNGTAHLSLYRDKARRAPRVWPHETQIRVRYRAGFVLPGEAGADLPQDVERAAILTVAALYRDPQSSGLPAEAVTLLQPFIGRPEALPGDGIARRRPYGRLRQSRY